MALNVPDRRPEGDLDGVRQYSQRKVDVIDLEANHLVSRDFREVAGQAPIFRCPSSLRHPRRRRATGSSAASAPDPMFTFDDLLSQTPFVADMRKMLHMLQEAYDYPVDIEFTANFSASDRYKINLVQCRPLQVASKAAVELPESISRKICFSRPTAR